MTAVAKRKASPIMSEAGRKSWETRRARMLNPPKPKVRPKLEPLAKIKMPSKVPVVSASDMMLKTVVLVLTFNGIGNRRQVDQSEIEIRGGGADVDKRMLNTTKQLIDAKELQDISSLDGEARRYVETRVLPSYIKRGIHLLPKIFDKEIEEKLTEYSEQRKALVDALASKLSVLKSEARERLGKLYNADDYWTVSELRNAFQMSWRLLYVDSAEGLSKEVHEKERKRAEADWKETRETIQKLLRSQLSDLVNHLVDRLEPDKDGRAKTFRSFDKLNDFLATFEARNITNDVQMKTLVEQAKSLMTKADDTELLRSDETVRDYVRKGFENIKDLLDPMVGFVPHRRIKVAD